MVMVRLYGYFRDCVKKREFEMKSGTVEDVLIHLIQEHDCFGDLLLEKGGSVKDVRVKQYVKIMVNGRGIEVLNGIKTAVGKDDDLVIFPPVGGG